MSSPAPTETHSQDSHFPSTPGSSGIVTPSARKKQKKSDATETLLQTINTRLLQTSSVTEKQRDRFEIWRKRGHEIASCQ